jgi:hypothetical protein
MVEQRPFKALVVGSSPTQPNWISSPRLSRETAPEAAERPIELRTKKAGKVSANEVKKDKTVTKTLKTATNSNRLGCAEAKWYKARNCYRVWVPARLSEKRKDCRRFFETKDQAEKFIFETKRSVQLNLRTCGRRKAHHWGDSTIPEIRA